MCCLKNNILHGGQGRLLLHVANPQCFYPKSVCRLFLFSWKSRNMRQIHADHLLGDDSKLCVENLPESCLKAASVHHIPILGQLYPFRATISFKST